jgi:pyruvate kinase
MEQLSSERLIEVIRELRDDALRQERELEHQLSQVHTNHTAAGRNLAHYLAVRQHDVRDLQRALSALGLSSLGGMERCVLSTLNAVEHALRCLSGVVPGHYPPAPSDFLSGEAQLRRNTEALLGPAPKTWSTHVMVTLPLDSSAELIEQLVRAGTNVLRINCSKGNREDWRTLIERARAAESRHGRSCRILCDLSGPNPRTLAFGREGGKRRPIARVSPGDRFLLVKDSDTAARERESAGLPVIGCTLPSIVDDLRSGERVYYDDGKVAGNVVAIRPGVAEIEVVSTCKKVAKIRPDKGLNFPDSRLNLPSLTEKDVKDLEFVVVHADAVGLSFVRRAEDVLHLHAELQRLEASDIGVVIKIETMEGFAELPRVLLAALRSPRLAVMVARGDMAVELGYSRLAEAQEEILWFCEAAMVPVIWATQVLETLNKTGVPSRAEVTDAAMGARAECVMLNQGEHVIEAVQFLCGVLERMHDHQAKKRSLLRRLRISELASLRHPTAVSQN